MSIAYDCVPRPNAAIATEIDPPVRDVILATIPQVRAFALSLCRNTDRVDDLLQETLTRALGNINSFKPGTNMSAWLITILRNQFRTEYCKRRHEVEDATGRYIDRLHSPPEQEALQIRISAESKSST